VLGGWRGWGWVGSSQGSGNRIRVGKALQEDGGGCIQG